MISAPICSSWLCSSCMFGENVKNTWQTSTGSVFGLVSSLWCTNVLETQTVMPAGVYMDGGRCVFFLGSLCETCCCRPLWSGLRSAHTASTSAPAHVFFSIAKSFSLTLFCDFPAFPINIPPSSFSNEPVLSAVCVEPCFVCSVSVYKREGK